MRLHLTQPAAQAGHEVSPSRLARQEWNDASKVSFSTTNAPLAAVIARAIGPGARQDAEIAQANAALSPDGRLVYAALAEKIGRQIVKLDAGEVAELRTDIARGLVTKERTEGPIALTPEQRRLVTTPENPRERPGRKPGDDATPSPPRRRR